MSLNRVYVMCLGLALVLSACGAKEESTNTDQASGALAQTQEVKAKQLSSKEVAIAKAQNIESSLSLTASVSANKNTIVSSQIEGQIQSLLVKEGQAVKQGQVLVILDAQVIKTQLDELASARVGLESNLNLAQSRLQKQKAMFEQGFISKMALQEFESQVAVLHANLQAQNAQRARLLKSSSDTQVRAPFSGVVAHVHVEAGEMLSKNQKVLNLVDLAQLEAQAQVANHLISQVKLGQRVQFDNAQMGTVERINPVAQTNTRTFTVYIKLLGQSPVRVGEFLKGRILLEEKQNVITVPKLAIQTQNDQAQVFIVKDKKLALQKVSLGLNDDVNDRVEVQGLAPGSVYLPAPILGLTQGDAVALPKIIE